VDSFLSVSGQRSRLGRPEKNIFPPLFSRRTYFSPACRDEGVKPMGENFARKNLTSKLKSIAKGRAYESSMRVERFEYGAREAACK
jgi:hypothetical protein